jgi:hypothetical protein
MACHYNYYWGHCCCCCTLEPPCTIEQNNVKFSENNIDKIVSSMNECDDERPLESVAAVVVAVEADDDEWVCLMKNICAATKWLVD